MKYGLHGMLKAKAGHEDKLAALLIKASEMMNAVKGCRLYLISRDPSEPDGVWVTEVWDAKEDHDNSLKLEEVRQLISQAIPILDGTPQRGQELEILGGHGL